MSVTSTTQVTLTAATAEPSKNTTPAQPWQATGLTYYHNEYVNRAADLGCCGVTRLLIVAENSLPNRIGKMALFAIVSFGFAMVDVIRAAWAKISSSRTVAPIASSNPTTTTATASVSTSTTEASSTQQTATAATVSAEETQEEGSTETEPDPLPQAPIYNHKAIQKLTEHVGEQTERLRGAVVQVQIVTNERPSADVLINALGQLRKGANTAAKQFAEQLSTHRTQLKATKKTIGALQKNLHNINNTKNTLVTTAYHQYPDRVQEAAPEFLEAEKSVEPLVDWTVPKTPVPHNLQEWGIQQPSSWNTPHFLPTHYLLTPTIHVPPTAPPTLLPQGTTTNTTTSSSNSIASTSSGSSPVTPQPPLPPPVTPTLSPQATATTTTTSNTSSLAPTSSGSSPVATPLQQLPPPATHTLPPQATATTTNTSSSNSFPPVPFPPLGNPPVATLQSGFSTPFTPKLPPSGTDTTTTTSRSNSLAPVPFPPLANPPVGTPQPGFQMPFPPGFSVGSSSTGQGLFRSPMPSQNPSHSSSALWFESPLPKWESLPDSSGQVPATPIEWPNFFQDPLSLTNPSGNAHSSSLLSPFASSSNSFHPPVTPVKPVRDPTSSVEPGPALTPAKPHVRVPLSRIGTPEGPTNLKRVYTALCNEMLQLGALLEMTKEQVENITKRKQNESHEAATARLTPIADQWRYDALCKEISSLNGMLGELEEVLSPAEHESLVDANKRLRAVADQLRLKIPPKSR